MVPAFLGGKIWAVTFRPKSEKVSHLAVCPFAILCSRKRGRASHPLFMASLETAGVPEHLMIRSHAAEMQGGGLE